MCYEFFIIALTGGPTYIANAYLGNIIKHSCLLWGTSAVLSQEFLRKYAIPSQRFSFCQSICGCLCPRLLLCSCDLDIHCTIYFHIPGFYREKQFSQANSAAGDETGDLRSCRCHCRPGMRCSNFTESC